MKARKVGEPRRPITGTYENTSKIDPLVGLWLFLGFLGFGFAFIILFMRT